MFTVLAVGAKCNYNVVTVYKVFSLQFHHKSEAHVDVPDSSASFPLLLCLYYACIKDYTSYMLSSEIIALIIS